jgi:hypothetical protein
MADNELRTKVAEFSGLWHDCGRGVVWTGGTTMDYDDEPYAYECLSGIPHQLFLKGAKCRKELPYYENDLNAMHEVEKIFVKHDGCAWGDDWELYCDNLGKVCFMSEPTNCLCRATAKQRAIAFVMTMDIIKNNKKYVLWRDIESKNNS